MASSEPELAHCSFCGKPGTRVAKMVAGPGVNICDACVDLSASIVAESLGRPVDGSRPRTLWASLSDGEMLAHIPNVAAHIEQAEADLRCWVQELRRRGVTWTRIGESLGITRQSAWERFSGED